MVNGRWTEKVAEVKGEVFRFYQDKFKENWVSHPKLISPYFRSVSMMDAIWLEAPFTIEEVKADVWTCGSEKPWGPTDLHSSS